MLWLTEFILYYIFLIYDYYKKRNFILNNYNDSFIERIININNKKIRRIKINCLSSIETEEILNIFLIKHYNLFIKNEQDYQFEKNILNTIPNDKYIIQYYNFLSYWECKQMIEDYENHKEMITQGTMSSGLELKRKYVDELLIHENNGKIWEKWKEILHNRLRKYFIKYMECCIKNNHNNYLQEIFNNPRINLSSGNFKLKKYTNGHSYYKWHKDGSSTKNSQTILSYIIYLNDVYKGGETCFYNGKIKAEMGKIVFFPSGWNYNHRSMNPESNDKYILNNMMEYQLL